MDQPRADVTLLTPVPREHLASGLVRCQETGYVAFGTDAGLVLSELKLLVDADHSADILFYASGSNASGSPAATFRGRFVDFDGSVAGRAKSVWQKHRPDTTLSDGAWLGFYLVSDLRVLDEPILLSSLTKRGNKGKLAKTFVPLGPLLIDSPF